MTGIGGPPLSLLFAIPTLPPEGGGAEVHAARLAEALRSRGHKVRFLTVDGDIASAWRRRGYFLRVARTLLADRKRYDVAHFFLSGRHTALGVLAARMAGRPSVVMYGGIGAFAERRSSPLGRLALRSDARRADRLIALNQDMREAFRTWGAPDDRIAVLPCEVDPELFSPGPAEAARARFGIPASARVVTFVGRFVAEKEIATLVAAFERVAAADPAAVLVLAGDGPDRSALQALVGRLPDPARVVMTGRLAETEVRDLLRASDVFVLPSSLEGIPCALVEAMAVGLPSVVSDIAGTREAVSPGAGLVVPLRSPQALAGALIGLLSDPGERRRLGDAARRIVLERYTTALVASAHERLYREILAGKAA